MKRAWLLTLLGVAIGAAAGWLYWHQWGCTGGCAITGSPLNSTLYGALMGGLTVNSFKRTDPSKGARVKECENSHLR
ncbi:MAG: hypothetical protein RBT71_09940 [Flavobacteriales bacterium]|jgi:hypothetical protein|nr:hypothetical protein [Flavobacteriales bacterium]